MRKTSFIRFAVAATAVAVLAGTTLPANAAVKPSNKAIVGDDCTAASAATKKVAKKKVVKKAPEPVTSVETVTAEPEAKKKIIKKKVV